MPPLKTMCAPLVAAFLFFACVGTQMTSARRQPATVPTRTEQQNPSSAPSQASPALPPGAYDLSELRVLTKVLYYVKNYFIDQKRFNARIALLGALDFVQRDLPEIVVESKEREVTVSVTGRSRNFSLDAVESPWTLRSRLQEIFRFVQSNLLPLPREEEGPRLLRMEMAASNGLLYTLDPHSALLGPEMYREMVASPEGRMSGGVGLVVEWDADGRIVVRRVLSDSAAFRAGMQAKDRIVRIGNDSTSHMSLADAVDRLRGEIGTNVEVYVERDGLKGAKKMVMTRAQVGAPALASPPEILEVPGQPGHPHAKIGYFRLESFPVHADDQVEKVLQTFKRQQVNGIIMDLRDNHGGLFDQAVKIADAFIKSGTLVSMVGEGSKRKDSTATDDEHEPDVPIAVLVNHRSAAASEVVAGAIKDLDRGVVIGETTFGEGSIQLLFEIPSPITAPTLPKHEQDRLTLKLTTAQWLTPAGSSIQGSGVTPDIEITRRCAAMLRGEKRINLEPAAPRMRESDYEWHLQALRPRQPEPPRQIVPYLYVPFADEPVQTPEPTWAGDSGSGPQSRLDANGRDFAMELAQHLLARAKTPRRQDILADSKTFLADLQAEEGRKLVASLAKLGIDWSPGPPTGDQGKVQVQLSATDGDRPVFPGASVGIRGTVKNLGSFSVYRVRAVLSGSSGIFDGKELVFGRIDPGQTRTFDLKVKIPSDAPSFSDIVGASVVAEAPLKARVAPLTVTVESKPRPQFSFSYARTDDPRDTPRDGVSNLGKVRLLVKVKNIGVGSSSTMEVSLRNAPGQRGVFISAGFFRAKDLAPGAIMTFSMVFEVDSDHRDNGCEFDLTVSDTLLGDSVTRRIRINWGDADAATGQVTPPNLTATAPRVVDQAIVHVTGGASGDAKLRDVFISVQSLRARKLPHNVFYLSNPNAQTQMPFSAEVPVQLGSNIVRVSARDADGVQTTTRLMVLRTQ